MKNHQGIVWAPILIMIGVVVVAGFATYFLVQNNSGDESKNINNVVVNQANNNINDNVNTNSPTNTNQSVNSNANTNTVANTNTTTDPTAGWKSYTNDTYGFSFNYPPTHSVSIEDTTFIISANDGSYPNPTLEVSSKSRDEVIADSIETEGSTQTPVTAGTVTGTKILENASIGGEILNHLFVHQNKTFLLRGTNTAQNQEIFSTLTFTN